MWKPRLVVRTGRGGGIVSPTRSAGHALFGAVGLLSIAVCVAAAFAGRPLLLIGLGLAGLPVYDAAAWFLATADERAAFVAEVQRRGGSSGERRIRARGQWPLVASLVVLGASIGLMLLGHPVAVAGVIVGLGAAVVLGLDRVRGS
jgi:hypothetical protein